MDWWIAFWTALSFFAIFFTGAVAIFAIWRSARERRDDRATAIIERYNTNRENSHAFDCMMPFSEADFNRLFVRASLMPLTHPNRQQALMIVGDDGMLWHPLRKPSDILGATRDLLNWLTECHMLYSRNLASRDMILELSALTALAFVYILDPIWDEIEREMALDLNNVRKLALLGQWYARRDMAPDKYGKLLNYCFTARLR